MRILKNVTLTATVTSEQCHIDIIDDDLCEPDETFYISLISLNDNCVVDSSSIPVTIVDDDGRSANLAHACQTVARGQ